MTTANTTTLRSSDITVGDDLPGFDLQVTSTIVVAGAIASRDFMPVHHDREYAISQGAPDMFMNILSTNGYVSRFITDSAGPEAMLRKIAIRLGETEQCDHDDDFKERGMVRSVRFRQ